MRMNLVNLKACALLAIVGISAIGAGAIGAGVSDSRAGDDPAGRCALLREQQRKTGAPSVRKLENGRDASERCNGSVP